MRFKRYQGKDRSALQAALRDRGFRSTEGRLALLSVLKRAEKPLAVPEILNFLGNNLDEVNVYRALKAFGDKGIVAQSDVRRGGAHYEYARSHHHHLICRDCGLTEDVDDCADKRMEKKVLANSRSFARIQTHVLEFFGSCKACAPRTSYV